MEKAASGFRQTEMLIVDKALKEARWHFKNPMLFVFWDSGSEIKNE